MSVFPPPHVIHVGDVGTMFVAPIRDRDDGGSTVVVDLSLGTVGTMFIRMHKPSGAAVDHSVSFLAQQPDGSWAVGGDGSNGVIGFPSDAGTYDEAGSWRWQAWVNTPSGSWWTQIRAFDVEGQLTAPAA